MSAATMPKPYELGRTVDPQQTPFAAQFQDLPAGLDRELAQRLLRGLYESDRVADDVVAEFAELPKGAGFRMLDTALAQGLDAVPDAPPALQAMLAPILDPPEWVNWELFDAGSVAFWRPSMATMFALSLALAYGYPIPRTSKILLATGRIDEMAGVRLLETGRWVQSATARGDMRPGEPGRGIELSLRVRLVHAFVRRHMVVQPDWDLERDGVPINVTDSAATIAVAFFTMQVRGVERLGIRYSPGELQAMAHMWRWIAFVMGVEEDLLPVSYEFAKRMNDIGDAAEQFTDPESGRTLTHALVRRGLPHMLGVPASRVDDLGRLTVPFTTALLRFMLGSESSDRIGLGFSPFSPWMRGAPLIGRAYNLMRAAGVMGSDAQMARLFHQMGERALKGSGAPVSTVHPETAIAESRTPIAA